jgi:hypothetical protein
MKRTLLAFIGLIAIAFAIVAAGYLFLGFYNVAATEQDPGFVNWGLIQVRKSAIARHAKDTPPPAFDEATKVRAGARAYGERGCVYCHGGPGADYMKFAEGLNPTPPDLKEVVGSRSPAELFWVVKHGIRMTGMPSFEAGGTPDAEIWSIVAFLKKLPAVSEADYKAWQAAP